METDSTRTNLFTAARILILLCVSAISVKTSAAQAPAPPDSGLTLSGHVTTATQQPLQGTTVTVSSTDLQLHRVTHTDMSGAYSFPSLPAGQYLLLAFHPGFYPEFFNMAPNPTPVHVRYPNDGNPHIFIQGVTLRSGGHTAPADFTLAASPPIATLQDGGSTSAGSRFQQQQLESAVFSPESSHLALKTLSNVSDDPGQVWCYDLTTHHLIAVVPTVALERLQLIATFNWRDTLLHVTGITRMGGRLFQEDLPADGALSITYKDHPFPYPQPENPTASAGPYKLTSQRLHGGSTSWLAQRNGKGPTHVIAAALLNTPVVDPAVPYFFYIPVTYPTTFVDDQVAALDLRSGHQTTQRLPVPAAQLLAVAPDSDGFLLAYQVRGGCEPTPNQGGEASEQINGFGGATPSTQEATHVCFVHLRRPE